MKKETQLKVMEKQADQIEGIFKQDGMLEKVDDFLEAYKKGRILAKDIGAYIQRLVAGGHSQFEIKLLMEKRADVLGFTPDEKKEILGVTRRQLILVTKPNVPNNKGSKQKTETVHKVDDDEPVTEEGQEEPVQIVVVECDKTKISEKDIIDVVKSKGTKFYIKIALPDKKVLGFSIKK